MLYVIGMITIFTGLDIDDIGSLVLILAQIMNFLIVYAMLKLDKVVPEEWHQSKFHVSNGVLVFCAILGFAACGVRFWLQCVGKPAWVLIGNLIMCVLSLGYSFWRYRSGKVTQVVTYEKN